MNKIFFKNKPNLLPYENDKVVIINDERWEEYDVEHETETEVNTGLHVFPIADATIKYKQDGGRVFIFNCSLPYLQEAENLKHVEENMVINKLFDFGGNDKRADIKFYIMAVLLLIAILIK